jgi:hypothetical protein
VILEYEFKRMLTCTCREVKNKLFLVLPLELAHELIDDHAFLIVGIVIVKRISSSMKVHCCGTRVLKRSISVIYYNLFCHTLLVSSSGCYLMYKCLDHESVK